MEKHMDFQEKITVWRMCVRTWHPTPDPFTAVCYLATEAGEALDAALRLQHPDHDRSHDRRRALGRELAQVLDMCCTAATEYGIDLAAELDAWLHEVIQRKPESADEGDSYAYRYRQLDEGLRLAAIHSPGYQEADA